MPNTRWSPAFVQRERISDTLQPSGVCRHPLHVKFHPIATADLGPKAVKIEQAFKAQVFGHGA
jgi:hypothetical protein